MGQFASAEFESQIASGNSSSKKDLVIRDIVNVENFINTDATWIKQTSLPQFICIPPIVTNSGNGALFAYCRFQNTEGLHILDPHKNQWIEQINLSLIMSPQYVTFDPSSRYLYTFYNMQTNRIDLTKNYSTKILPDIGVSDNEWQDVSISIINRRYHIQNLSSFGLPRTYPHSVHHENDPLNTLTRSGKLELSRNYKTIYLRKRKVILFIDAGYERNRIWEYSMRKNKFRELMNTTKRLKIFGNGFGCAVTLDENYVIIFKNHSQNIFYIDTRRRNICIMKCNVLCPKYGVEFYAVSMNEDTDLLIAGFLVGYCGVDRDWIGVDVVEKMKVWVRNEWIHLFEQTSMRHWKISVDFLIPQQFEDDGV